MRVFIVRHAHAGDREKWKGDDRLRPLSEKGRVQATGLVRLLAEAQVGRILSSPFLRCVETVEPLATAVSLQVETEPVLAEGGDWHDSLELALQARVPTVMCSQGDVIGDLLAALVAAGLVNPGEAKAQKGSTWDLTIGDGKIIGAAYLPPPGL